MRQLVAIHLKNLKCSSHLRVPNIIPEFDVVRLILLQLFFDANLNGDLRKKVTELR